MELRYRLAKVITAHVARSKRYSSPAAAERLMLERLDVAFTEIEHGKSIARALYDNFGDRILTALEKAAGVPVTYGGGGKSTGRPA